MPTKRSGKERATSTKPRRKSVAVRLKGVEAKGAAGDLAVSINNRPTQIASFADDLLAGSAGFPEEAPGGSFQERAAPGSAAKVVDLGQAVENDAAGPVHAVKGRHPEGAEVTIITPLGSNTFELPGALGREFHAAVQSTTGLAQPPLPLREVDAVLRVEENGRIMVATAGRSDGVGAASGVGGSIAAAVGTASSSGGRRTRRRRNDKIVTAVRRNKLVIASQTAQMLILVEERLEGLRADRSNYPDTIAANEQAIKFCEELKTQISAFRDVVIDGKDEGAIAALGRSFVEGVGNWWKRRHVEFFDTALFASALTICWSLDFTGDIPIAVCAALTGSKGVVEAIKALRDKED